MNMNHGLESRLLAYYTTGLNSWLNVRFLLFSFFFFCYFGEILKSFLCIGSPSIKKKKTMIITLSFIKRDAVKVNTL